MIVDSKVVESSNSPVSLVEVKSHLKLVGDDEDSMLTIYIKAATNVCESYTGLSFTEQTRTVSLNSFPCGGVILPYGPVTSVDSFDYVDADDADQVLEVDTGFTADNTGGLYKLNAVDSWPVGGKNLIVGYTAGYATTPAELKLAVLQCVADIYEGRQGEGGMISNATRVLLDAYKVYWSAYV